MVDEGTKKQLQSIPLLQTRASPRDKDLWVVRLKEELMALVIFCFALEIVLLHGSGSIDFLLIFNFCSKSHKVMKFSTLSIDQICAE